MAVRFGDRHHLQQRWVEWRGLLERLDHHAHVLLSFPFTACARGESTNCRGFCVAPCFGFDHSPSCAAAPRELAPGRDLAADPGLLRSRFDCTRQDKINGLLASGSDAALGEFARRIFDGSCSTRNLSVGCRNTIFFTRGWCAARVDRQVGENSRCSNRIVRTCEFRKSLRLQVTRTRLSIPVEPISDGPH